jgi:hypothetical protein
MDVVRITSDDAASSASAPRIKVVAVNTARRFMA